MQEEDFTIQALWDGRLDPLPAAVLTTVSAARAPGGGRRCVRFCCSTGLRVVTYYNMVPTVAVWDRWNIEHIRRHGVTPEEVEEVLANASTRVIENPSPASNRPAIFGYTNAGRPLMIAYDILDDDLPRRIYPVTAYEPGP